MNLNVFFVLYLGHFVTANFWVCELFIIHFKPALLDKVIDLVCMKHQLPCTGIIKSVMWSII